jgi:hypothetical protein
MAGISEGLRDAGMGYSQWIMAAWVALNAPGLRPHAASVQKGAPEPPEKRDH